MKHEGPEKLELILCVSFSVSILFLPEFIT